MSNNPEVSVIIPTYNRSDLLQLTIKSVQAQTFRDLEIIIIDDGSKDDTRRVVEGLQNIDQRIVYIYQENRGLPSARNIGIKNSHGKYIAFLDSDDLWKPEKIEKQLLIFNQNQDIEAVYVNFINIDFRGDLMDPYIPSTDPYFQLFSLYEKLLYFCAVVGSGSSVMAKRTAIIRTGDFDETLCSAEDWDFWRRMALQSKFYFLDEYLLFIRRHEDTMSKKLDQKWKGEYRHLQKMYLKTPEQYRFHLPETAYKMYKNYLKEYFSRRDFHGLYMGFSILMKILRLGYQYPIRLATDFLRAFKIRLTYSK